MKIFHYSEIGSHDENEDAIGIVAHNSDSSLTICALADGQGGQSGGAAAAKRAVSFCLAKAQSISPSELLNPFAWEEIGEYVDKNIAQLSETGFTTFIGFCITNSFVVGASCGDSAVALSVNENFLILTKNQLKNPPIGSSGARLTPFSALLDGKWKLLAISDGVWKFTDWNSIVQICKSESCENLISSLRENVILRTKELVDDFSIILIES